VNSVDELSIVKEMRTLFFHRRFVDWPNKASSGAKWPGCWLDKAHGWHLAKHGVVALYKATYMRKLISGSMLNYLPKRLIWPKRIRTQTRWLFTQPATLGLLGKENPPFEVVAISTKLACSTLSGTLICGKNPTSLVVASASDDLLNGAGKRNKKIVREPAATTVNRRRSCSRW
jgi:hypothetical protein